VAPRVIAEINVTWLRYLRREVDYFEFRKQLNFLYWVYARYYELDIVNGRYEPSILERRLSSLRSVLMNRKKMV
jgi:hypothetical protein